MTTQNLSHKTSTPSGPRTGLPMTTTHEQDLVSRRNVIAGAAAALAMTIASPAGAGAPPPSDKHPLISRSEKKEADRFHFLCAQAAKRQETLTAVRLKFEQAWENLERRLGPPPLEDKKMFRELTRRKWCEAMIADLEARDETSSNYYRNLVHELERLKIDPVVYEKRLKELNAAFGIRGFEDQEIEAIKHLEKAAEALISEPARTPTGVLAKLQAIHSGACDDREGPLEPDNLRKASVAAAIADLRSIVET